MTKLNQIIAIANGEKSRCQKTITEVHHKLQKVELLSGITRVYNPKDEDGDVFPPESTKVNYTVDRAISDVKSALEIMFQVVNTQDMGNCNAIADVVVDGVTLLNEVPVTTLLFLEKQLQDINTFVNKLPVLDSSEDWEYSDIQDCWVSATKATTKTKKIPKVIIKYDATPEHPAQTELFTEDVVIGTWDTTKFSGGITLKRKTELQERVRLVINAVKSAREAANSIDVQSLPSDNGILNFIFE